MKNILGLWPNLSRAIEVAKTGKFTLTVYANTREYPQAFDDYAMIKKSCGGFFMHFHVKGDMYVEISKPREYYPTGQFETQEDIGIRIHKSRENKLPSGIVSQVGMQLIKQAIDRYEFSYKQTEAAIRIAIAIAQMEGKESIGPEHIAEAIHYQIYPQAEKYHRILV